MRKLNQIRECRRFELNGLPEYLAREVRGERKRLEEELDRQKTEARETYLATAWN